MSSRITKRKNFDKTIIRNLTSISYKLNFNSFKSALKYTIPFSEFFTQNPEKFVYTDTRGIPFNKLHPEFQQIIKKEFQI